MACKPLFIFGLARSGTNLLARMLDRHPDVTVALDPYLPLFRSLRNALVASRAAKEVRQRFSSSAPFQDYYFDPDGAALLDLMLAGEANLPLDQDELKVLRLKAGERASLESPTLGAQTVSYTHLDVYKRQVVAFVVLVELRGPHLVLTDVRGDDGLALGEGVELINDCLLYTSRCV